MRTLLAVDDNVFWLNTLTRWFTECGYAIHTATNRLDAIKMTESILPDCVLLDFQLNDGTAVDICNFIRGSEKLRKTPVIIISGHEEAEITAHQKCLADGFIVKSTPLHSIQLQLETLLRRVGLERGIYEKGDICVQASERQVFRGDILITELSPEHFRFFSLLLEKSPEFVSEEEICRTVLNSEFSGDKCDALKMMAYRLRQKLGVQLGRRIKNKKDLGWIYVQPRVRASHTPKDGPDTAAS